MRRSDDLTEKQRKFVTEYLRNGKNAGAAYRAAYATRASDGAARVEASKLLRHPKIVPILAEAERQAAEAIRSSVHGYAMSKAELQSRLTAAFLEAQAAKHWTGMGRLGELLSRLGGYVVETRNVRVIRSVADLTDEELEALAAADGTGATAH